MVPTYRYFQAIYSMYIYALLLFRMMTVFDLECLIEEYKNDLSEHGALTAPEISVVYKLQTNQ